jgi:hypothetical protein
LTNSSTFVHTASKSARRSVLAKKARKICRKGGLSNSVKGCIVPIAQLKRGILQGAVRVERRHRILLSFERVLEYNYIYQHKI